MWSRQSLAPQETIGDRFEVAFGSDAGFGPRYNAAPGQELPGITGIEQNSQQPLKWELIPRWADDTTERYINARSETAKESRRSLNPMKVVEPLHHQMAVILSPEQEYAWLNGVDVSFEPIDAQGFQSYPVSTAVNDPTNDSPEILEPVDI